MVVNRRKKNTRPSREDVASREPNILQMCTMKFGYPGTPPSEIKRPHLKRQAEAFAGGDPFFDEQGERSPKKRRIQSLPIGLPKDKHVLLCRGSAAAARRYRKIPDSSPTAAKTNTNTGRKSKQLITADESTTFGRLDLFAWQSDYIHTTSSRATAKSKKRQPPKKSRQAVASRLVLGKGIADVGVWLGKDTTSSSHALARQFSGDSLLDGILGTSTALTRSVALRHQHPLRQRSLNTPTRTPVSVEILQTPTKVTGYKDVTRNDSIEGEFITCLLAVEAVLTRTTVMAMECDINEPATPGRQLRSSKRAREGTEEPGTALCTPTRTPRKRIKKMPSPPPIPTVVTRSMKRKMEARGVRLSLTALP
ncbi:uncharacterized protein PG986_001527 [Apiospora aurea]|uniref:Uncharacterized protein n=1 Tax=Apiospora aurea TaxID=335848 RepID=A0ABR1QX28_9PEZI